MEANFVDFPICISIFSKEKKKNIKIEKNYRAAANFVGSSQLR
jgi:hypothetical protein